MAEGAPGHAQQLPEASRAGEQDLVARARSLRPAIEAAAAETERSGARPRAVLDALHDARLFRMLLPASAGGLETPPAVFIEVLEALAGADCSIAWVVAQGCGCSLSAAYLPAPTARAVFGARDAVLAWGPSGSGATARATAGGYVISGRWHFASGNRHAQWLGAHCSVIEADGRPRLDAAGMAVERTAIFPRASARIQDDWNVMGLKGTGSDSYSVDGLFVPDAWTYRREAADERRENGPLYQFSGMSMFAFGIAAMALGVARAMLEAFTAHARTKTERTTGRPLRESGVIQAEVAKAEAKLLSSRMLMLATAHELHGAAAAGVPFSLDQRTRMRLSTTWASTLSREVADFAYTAAGAQAIFAGEPFERRFRDMHTLTQQVQAHAANFELVGQSLLGGASNSRLL